MVEHGYSGCYRVLDSQWFGVAQRRRRLFGVFARGDSGAERAAKVLSLTEGLRWHPAPSREAEKSVARSTAPCFEVSGTLDRKSCGANRGSQANEAEFIAIADVVHGDKQCNGKGWNDSGVAYTLDTMGTQGVCAPTVMAHKQGNAEVTEDICPTLNCNHEQPIYFEPRFTRISSGAPQQEGVASTLLSGHHGGDGAPHIAGQVWGVRRLTPMECERLQGFPDDWAASLSDAQRYKALGNAVTVNVAEWIAKRLIKEM